MPNYRAIDPHTVEGRRIAERLGKLRKAMRAAGIPPSRRDDNLLIATWNLREFGKVARSDESIYYIAEILSRFDVIAIQEVRGDIGDFKRLFEVLGPWWKYLLTDITEGERGNDERLAFVYNSRKVQFGGLAGQIVLPAARQKKGRFPTPVRFARTPFQVGFTSGWFRFQICTTHAYYGADKPDVPQRKAEITRLAQHLIRRANDEGEHRLWARHFLLLGDFNIFTNEDRARKALEKEGFRFPDKLAAQTSGFGRKERHYDQISFYTPSRMYGGRLEKAKMSTFDFFEVVYTDDDEKLYPAARRDERGFRQWRTYQMSDHKPLWIEFATDSADAFLWAVAKGKSTASEADVKSASRYGVASRTTPEPPPHAGAVSAGGSAARPSRRT